MSDGPREIVNGNLSRSSWGPSRIDRSQQFSKHSRRVWIAFWFPSTTHLSSAVAGHYRVIFYFHKLFILQHLARSLVFCLDPQLGWSRR